MSSPSTSPSLRASCLLLLVFAVLGTVGGGAAALTSDERWLVSAKVLLQIGPETAGTRPSMVGSPAPFLAGNPRREDVQTEVELLGNPDLLRRAFDKLLAEDAEAALGPDSGRFATWLRSWPEQFGLLPARSRAERALDKWASALRIAVVPASTVLVVECRATRPAAAVRMLEHMLALYLEDHRAAFGGRGMPPVLAGFVADCEQRLADAETRLTRLRQEHAVVDVVQETTQGILARTAAETKARELRATMQAAEARLRTLTELLDQTPGEQRSQSELRPNPLRDDLDARLVTARQALLTARQEFTDGTVEVRRAQELVAMLEELAAKAAPNRDAGVTTARNPLADSLRDLTAKARAEVAATTAEHAATAAAASALGERLLRVEAARSALQKAEQDVTEAKKDLTQAHDGLRLARVEHLLDEHQVANVTVVGKPGYLPTPMRSFGLPTRIAITLGGMAFGIGLAVTWILWRRSRATPSQA